MKKTLIASFAAVFMAAGAFAFNVDKVFSPEDAKKLKEGGKLEKISFLVDDASLSLTPDTPLSKEASVSWPKRQETPNFLVEEVYLISKSELGSASTATVDYASKLLRSFSKMEGIEYYSHSEQKMTVLYETAHTIAGPKDTKKIADDTAGDADGQVRYCLLDDHSLSKSTYRVTYSQREDEVRACLVNLSSLKVGPIKAIGESALRMNIVISDMGDYLCLYLTSEAKVPKLKILEERMQNSFSARLDALYNWFRSEYEAKGGN